MGLLRRFLCLIGSHKWTSPAAEGANACEYSEKYGPVLGLREYSRVYCRHCKKESELSKSYGAHILSTMKNWD